jgi:phytoene dehydrogenase-like protein
VETKAETNMKVIVIGGGFAGLSAAIRITERHHDVTLLERRGVLGGRASSYRDSVSGDDIDGGHVLFAAHRATLNLLQRAGASHCVERLPALLLDRGQGLGTVRLFSGALPAPWHALPGLLALRLSPRDLRRAWRLLRGAPSAVAVNETLATLLGRGDGTLLLRRLMEPLCLLLCRAPAKAVSARLFLSALQSTLTRTVAGARPLGFPPGLGEIHQRLAAYFAARGGHIVYGARAEAIEIRAARVCGVTYNQRPRDRASLRRGERGQAQRIAADAVVSTVPWHALGALFPESVRAVPPFSLLDQLRPQPATSMAVWLERPLPVRGLVGLAESELGWLTERHLAGRENGPGSRYWHASFTAAAQVRRNIELEAGAAAALQRGFPLLGPGNLMRGIVLREPTGTHAQDPEAIGLRRTIVTDIGGLFLAGDWTDTTRPASIESAVLSGRRAADALQQSRCE